MKNNKKIFFIFFLIFIFLINFNYSFGTSNETSNNLENDPDVKQAMYACDKAIKLATMYGTIVDLSEIWNKTLLGLANTIKQEIKDKITKEIKSTVEQITKDKLGEAINIEEVKNKFKEYIGDNPQIKEISQKFKSIIPSDNRNPISNFEKEVKNKINNAFKESIKEFSIIKNTGLEELTKDLNITGLLNLNQADEVPVDDKGTKKVIEEATRKIIDSQVKTTQAILNEQKRQQMIQTLREKCTLILKETVAEIKNNLLFQLSTQIIDWALNDRNFLKNTKTLENIVKRTVYNNFLSNVVPELCSNFNFDTYFSLALEEVNIQTFQVGSTKPPFEWRCTLDEAEQNIENIKKFIKDFKEGGIGLYIKLLRPENDPVITALNIAYEQAKEYNKQMKEFEKLQKNGFLAKTTCKIFRLYERIPYDQKIENSNIIYYSYYKYKGTEYLFDTEEWEKFYEQNKNYMIPDFTGPIYKNSTYYLFSTPISQLTSTVPYSQNIGIARCEEIEITQPASVTENYLNKVTQQELDTLKEAEELENYFENIKKSIINKLIIKNAEKGLSDALNWFIDKTNNSRSPVPLIRDIFKY